MRWSDIPAVNDEVWLLLCDSLGENPYRTAGREKPSPMTRADLINTIRADFGECAAESVRLPVH
ncbi:hypothetical protein [Bradyrhizobium symbiodeficiens]|uniref:hypothetical protein n=1 Tax=Bradyrhizobium symbiodeficiens TaxID=1404367 RepID=UPI000BA1A682|nr:hypothetical protein [Bradyrhizobium symbiodeficiens]AWM07625.1 hypothetical protein CIT39_15005 [Bradyrhizobium symbiodeficiens]